MKNIFRSILIVMLALVLYGSSNAQDCDPLLSGMTFSEPCISGDNTATLSVGWTMFASSLNCSAPAGSWRILISFPANGIYGPSGGPNAVNGPGFDWQLNGNTLTGTSNMEIEGFMDGTIEVEVEGFIDPDPLCFITLSGANIQPLLSSPQSFANNTSNDALSAGLGVDVFGALPVEFLHFKATPHREWAMLQWATASEKDNSGFEIQRSKDGQAEWENIGWVDGNGTVSTTQNYEFLDREPYNGVNYYRLKQLDTDGRFEYSPVRTVEFSLKIDELSVFPNPVKDVVNIKLPTRMEGEVTIQLLDVFKQVVKEKTLDYSGAINDEFNVSNLPAGTYFVHVINRNFVGSKPFIKKH